MPDGLLDDEEDCELEEPLELLELPEAEGVDDGLDEGFLFSGVVVPFSVLSFPLEITISSKFSGRLMPLSSKKVLGKSNSILQAHKENANTKHNKTDIIFFIKITP